MRLLLPITVGAVMGSLFLGALTIEQPLWGGAALGILVVAPGNRRVPTGYEDWRVEERKVDALVGVYRGAVRVAC